MAVLELVNDITALSFHAAKMILDHQNHFGQVQIIKISPEKSNFNLIKMI